MRSKTTHAVLGKPLRTLEVMLDEAVEAAGEYLRALVQYREALRNARDEGELGAVSSALFLLKLKAEDAYEQLDKYLESLPDESE